MKLLTTFVKMFVMLHEYEFRQCYGSHQILYIKLLLMCCLCFILLSQNKALHHW